ncbi:MAG: Asp-tRNA(Asn)/Glu-tRNA(Gln) amidotransferase GatCAB subunit A [Phycisphaeraceae bacterium]|nr:Asp-tRNA(Asn)/Glu-tRNA(Gln) amidotransferase GatCAB subunit A [Phycisphaeraceae bacterium]
MAWNPTQTTLVNLRNAIAASQTTSVQIVQQYLDRIERYNPQLNAFTQIFADQALQRAQRIDTGDLAGPLAGIPIAIKDNMCTPYGRTTCSSRILENFAAPYTATAVEKLEAAGAIVLGKTNLDEFAMGSSTEHSAFGTTRNPWSTDHVPGGSSGGSAVAVAADLAPGALGSDTGGSIRQPAALCGVVGLKPTYGRVSRYGLVAFASSLDQIGPFAHTVGDVALLLEVLCGPDPLDSTSVDAPAGPFHANLDQPVDGLRLGLPNQYLSDANHPSVAGAIDEAVEVFRGLGAQIVEVDLPHTEYGIATYYIVATAEASSNLARYDGVRYGRRADDTADMIDLYCRSRSQGFGDEVKRRIMLGTYALSSGYYDAYYLRALKVRRLIKQDFDGAFEKFDAILCPTSTGPAFKIGEKTSNPLAMYLNDIYTATANLAGIPGISIPAGHTKSHNGDPKLPVSIQFLGPLFGEARLLRIARMYEAATNHHLARPELAQAD